MKEESKKFENEIKEFYRDIYHNLKSKYMEFNPIYLALTQEKYLRFFNDHQRPEYSDDISIYSEFLDLTRAVFDILGAENKLYGDIHPKPKELLSDIRKKYLTEGDYFTPHLEIFSTDKYINDFTLWEILALIWYSSCRNLIIFDIQIYANCCNNGTVGRFLIRLKQLIEAEI